MSAAATTGVEPTTTYQLRAAIERVAPVDVLEHQHVRYELVAHELADTPWCADERNSQELWMSFGRGVLPGISRWSPPPVSTCEMWLLDELV